MSVMGQDEGIDHGTPRGHRQHRRRGVPETDDCGCLDAFREANRSREPVRQRSEKQKRWHGGKFVHNGDGSQPGRPILRPGQCRTEGCGQESPDPVSQDAPGSGDQETPAPNQQRVGWIRVHVPGSMIPPRTYCSGFCASIGLALTELRMK